MNMNDDKTKICPKCGARSFVVTAHVTQDWLVDEHGGVLSCIDECVVVTHQPDDEDLWFCANCLHKATGAELNEDAVEEDMIANVREQMSSGGTAQFDLCRSDGETDAHVVVSRFVGPTMRVSMLTTQGELMSDENVSDFELGAALLAVLKKHGE